MSQISVADNELVTLINVFNVEPQNQDKLIKLLERAHRGSDETSTRIYFCKYTP